ncbi:MAG TPA: hypothetical protein VND93_11725, partial [Myxococcales bacterium]|nr:hypothetical protein [Myxococcales bacterium]
MSQSEITSQGLIARLVRPVSRALRDVDRVLGLTVEPETPPPAPSLRATGWREISRPGEPAMPPPTAPVAPAPEPRTLGVLRGVRAAPSPPAPLEGRPG